MKKITTILINLILISLNSFAQNDTTPTYQNLPTIKLYTPNLTPPDTCCPCILQFYDENNILFKEQVFCRKYEVGYVKEYYPNGNLKVSGQYLENHTGNWDYMIASAKCCFQVGKWTYFDENGDTLYHEYWNYGSFIEQVPEQEKTEIWYCELYLGDKIYYSQLIHFDEFTQLQLRMKFKNSHRENLNITTNIIIISPNKKQFVYHYIPGKSKKVNIKKLLKKAGIAPEDYSMDEFAIDLYPGDINTKYKIQILNNGIVIAEHEIFLYP